ncbi:MAG: ABC transporter permease [Nitrososphaerales archaeon]
MLRRPRLRFSSRGNLGSYLKRRLLTAVLVFFVVYVINFILPRLEPGNVVDVLASSELLPQQREQLIQMLGINQPLSVQFLDYLKDTFGSFPPSFGVSFAHYPLTVWTLVMAALPWTLMLVLVSQAIAWTGGVLLGAWLGWRHGSKADSVMFGISNFMWGVPSYWLATILIFIFAIEWKIFPPALSTSGLVTGLSLSQISNILDHSFLPILTLVLLNLPTHALVMRNTMVNVLREDFITAAKARGLKSRTLILGHAARNALLPSVTNLALSFGAVLSGAYLVEIIYSYPGLGYLIEQSALTRDYPVLEGVFFFSAILVIVANIIADIAYVYLDPRVEY